MKSKTEKQIENQIKEFIEKNWWIVKKLHSGSVLTKSGSKTYKIQLESKWTTDLVVELNDFRAWVEVKKNKEEYEKWKKLEERFIKWEKLPKSYHREEAQIREKYYLLWRWWTHILTYSLKDFILKFNKYYKWNK